MSSIKKIVCSVAAVISLIVGGTVAEIPLSQSETPKVEFVELSIGKPSINLTLHDQAIGFSNYGELLVSPRALELIGDAESCRLNPYVCPAGLITNGIGNTHGVDDKPITLEQVAKDWVRNIQSSEKCLVASMGTASMSQGHIDAFTSFIFNTGCTRFKHNRDGSETRIYKHIKNSRYTAACHELRFWVYGGRKKLNGLVTRRAKETEICLL